MVVGRARRRAMRTRQVEIVVGKAQVPAALDLLELVEFAWHDCYAEVTPPDHVVEDILVCSRGELAQMIRCARLAVNDWRDLHVAAEAIRSQR